MAELKSTKAFGSFEVYDQLYDSFGNSGTSGQVLKSTGTGIKWDDLDYLSAIYYVAGTSYYANLQSFTLSGLQPGDFVLYIGAEDSNNVATPTGETWFDVPGITNQPDNDDDPNSGIFYTFASGTSVTASGLSADPDDGNSVHVMIAFRNVDPATPFDASPGRNETGSGLPNPPSVTTVTNSSMIVVVGLQDDEDIANSMRSPTGYTKAIFEDSEGGSNSSGLGGATIATAYKLLATASTENPASFTCTNSNASDDNKGYTIPLRQKATSISAFILAKGDNNNARVDNSDTTATNVDDNWLDPAWLDTSQNSSDIAGFDQPTATAVTIPATGIYIVNVNLGIRSADSNTNDRRSAEVVLLVNSTREAYRAAHSYLRGSAGHEQTSSNHSTILSLTEGDTVAIQWRPTCTGRSDNNADSVMEDNLNCMDLIKIA